MFDLGKSCHWKAFNCGCWCFWIKQPSLSKNRAIFRNYDRYSKCREPVKNSHTVMDIIFWNFTTLQKNLDPPQIKRWSIGIIKNVLYELRHQLLNELSNKTCHRDITKRNISIGKQQFVSFSFFCKNFAYLLILVM